VDPSSRGERASAWSLLGLPEGADVAAIKQAYRRKALVAHPDRGGDAATFREVTRAYEKLLARVSKRRRK
jgi:curved DNA-binding protein CbpA